MKIIKRKIVLDDYISREPTNWGQMMTNSFNINLFITQDSDDMGVVTDLDFVPKNNVVPNYQALKSKLISLGFSFNFMNGGSFNVFETGYEPNVRFPFKSHSDYFIEGGVVSGLTEDRLDIVKSYDRNFTYKPLFDVDKEVYSNYQGNIINGVTRVNDNINELNPITYSEYADVNDPEIGTINQSGGIFFRSFMSTVRRLSTQDLGFIEIPLTQMYYQSQGFNQTNTLLEANTKEEYLFGITSTPEVESDVFIDRGRVTVLQNHLQLSEITNMGELINYGNGYYKIIK